MEGWRLRMLRGGDQTLAFLVSCFGLGDEIVSITLCKASKKSWTKFQGAFWERNEHNNLALMVVESSPVRRSGSILNFAPSISPTPRSALLTLLGSPGCVPPVILSVFSSTSYFGTYSGSTEMSSGGALSAPTDGTSFFVVDVVFVKCGLAGFDF